MTGNDVPEQRVVGTEAIASEINRIIITDVEGLRKRFYNRAPSEKMGVL